MKNKFTLLFVSILLALQAYTQVPDKISYQAVIRDNTGSVVANSNVGIRIGILQGSEAGTPVYIETHAVSTNINGLATLQIGAGTVTTGIFADINWSLGPYFLQTETDVTGGTNYNISGVSQILSVPYALLSKSALSADYNNLTGKPLFAPVAISGDFNDLINPPSLFSGSYSDLSDKPALFDGAWTSISGKPTTVAGFAITDAVKTSGAQTIAGGKIFNNTITAKNGMNASNKSITNLASPINPGDAANKAYVDALKDAINNVLLDAGMKGFVQDIEGNIYKTVKIGDQIWMAENLRTTTFNDGTPIDYINDSTYWLPLDKYTGEYANYDNDENNAKIYGRLYTSKTISRAHHICPSGWHYPTVYEWLTLEAFLGDEAGGMLKDTVLWQSPNLGATNSTGFSALPAGTFYVNGSQEDGISWEFVGLGLSTLLSGAGQYDDYDFGDRFLQSNSADLIHTGNYETWPEGFSVRCIKD